MMRTITDAEWRAFQDLPEGHYYSARAWFDGLLASRVAEPQGEPSDAQVAAALKAEYRTDMNRSGARTIYCGTLTLADWNPDDVERMRASLRAAGEVR